MTLWEECALLSFSCPGRSAASHDGALQSRDKKAARPPIPT